MSENRPLLRALLASALAAVCTSASAQERDFSQVEIRSEKLADNLYVLTGAGGNMGLLVGADGAVLIDDQFAPLSERIRAAIAQLTDAPVRFVINTHYHFDHTGGNEAFGRAGSVIIAHENTRERIADAHVIEYFEAQVAPTSREGLPVVTFDESLTLHLNGERIDAVHVPNAHTDSDVLLHFRNANVVHMGDVLQGPYYPFIDMGAGGSVDGVIAAISQVLARTEGSTRFIAGHAPVVSHAELTAFRDMLVTVRERISAAIAAGKSQEEVVAAQPTREFDERYARGFIKPDVWVQRTYLDLKRKTQARQ